MKKYLFLLLLISANSYSANLEVIDGDTIKILNINEIDPKLLPIPNIRIKGIDTPETGKKAKCLLEKKKGSEAKEFVKSFIANKNATFKIKTITKGIDKGKYSLDKYGRLLADVFVDNVSLADTLIKKGLAKEYHGKGSKFNWCKNG
jgi:endonuclease YncB( thermonuclease family)